MHVLSYSREVLSYSREVLSYGTNVLPYGSTICGVGYPPTSQWKICHRPCKNRRFDSIQMTQALKAIPGMRLNALADEIEDQYLRILELQRALPTESEQKRVADEAHKSDEDFSNGCMKILQDIEKLNSRMQRIREFVYARPVQPNIEQQWDARQKRARDIIDRLNKLINRKKKDNESAQRCHDWERIKEAYYSESMTQENRK